MVLLLCMLLVGSSNEKEIRESKFSNFGEFKRLEWLDPYGRKPKRYKKWVKDKQDLRWLKIGTASLSPKVADTNLVDIIVECRIYHKISSEIEQFSTDLTNEGYAVQIDTVSGMSHELLRAHLASFPGLVGAIFVGELPTAWYEMDVWGEEEFPIDLYFMDLDGEWIDTNGNGLYDDHTGNFEPDIWVGRIYARQLLWDDEISLMKQYFEKNHQNRTIGLGIPKRALAFVDDDWNYFGSCGLDTVYSDVTVINDDTATIASRYREELYEGYEWVQLCAHSSPWGHTFRVPDGYSGTIFNYEIFILNPVAIFYNLFSCSGTRFVEENYSAGWYIFGDSYGLTIIGSTKTGSMLYFDDFYKWLGWGDNIGDSFKKWFIQWGEDSRPWFYGLNIIGDPTLKPLIGAKLALTRPSMSMYSSNGWSTPEVVSSNPEADGNPDIASIDGKLWFIFESGRSSTNGRSDIYSIYKDASSWSGTMNIGPHVYWDFNPAIGVHEGEPIAVWANFGWDGYDLKYSKYRYGSWIPSRIISSDPSWDLKPSIASAGDTLWLTWQTRRELNSDIYVSCLRDTVWSTPERVTQSESDESSPAIIIDRDNIPWVFYHKFVQDASQIYCSHRDGLSWTEDGPISGAQLSAYSPSATVDSDGRIWVSWQAFDEGEGNIYVSYYGDGSWSLPVKITSYCENNIFPSMTTDSQGKCWIAWQGKSAGNWNIYVSCSPDTLWAAQEVIELPGPDINPKIVSDSNGVWATWQNYQSSNWDIYASSRAFVGINENYDGAPDVFWISRCHPNPFTEFTSINYFLPTNDKVSLKIYDITGRVVKVLIDEEVNAGYHTIGWDGKDASGNKIASGIYFCRIEGNKFKAARKLIALTFNR
ncbi:hypothetical protein CH333_09830 [candidate division WOR-3 bacterium JGI_Cruoil_03_44_89]|uniref:FlgD/Vpr Ig-like domain-containing protein n=1 Tax=candidate division WOR-3 bacterium JGI_Cruoil_03_44_89 TaxID=1973748 RepID=A0A235BQ31_UNCW3|nr:MAG: hypothetical protein CH333_09830 [candidate division WOR-3 bacterium JGI_Cruoil_03_44_89]